MDAIGILADRLRTKIERHNRSQPGKKIHWELRADKLRDLIKHEFSIPDKFKKTTKHKSNKYLSRDEVKYLDSLLNDLAGEAIEERINIYPMSPTRSFSRSRSRSLTPLRERVRRVLQHARATRTTRAPNVGIPNVGRTVRTTRAPSSSGTSSSSRGRRTARVSAYGTTRPDSRSSSRGRARTTGPTATTEPPSSGSSSSSSSRTRSASTRSNTSNNVRERWEAFYRLHPDSRD